MTNENKIIINKYHKHELSLSREINDLLIKVYKDTYNKCDYEYNESAIIARLKDYYVDQKKISIQLDNKYISSSLFKLVASKMSEIDVDYNLNLSEAIDQICYDQKNLSDKLINLSNKISAKMGSQMNDDYRGMAILGIGGSLLKNVDEPIPHTIKIFDENMRQINHKFAVVDLNAHRTDLRNYGDKCDVEALDTYQSKLELLDELCPYICCRPPVYFGYEQSEADLCASIGWGQ